MARLRTFIALDPGKAIRGRIVTLQETLARAASGVKWVEEDNLHVTLLFLGEVDMLDVPKVCNVVSEVTAEHTAFSMTIERAGAFPSLRRPRILWVGVGEGTQEVCSLHDDLEGPLAKLGCYRREERQYTPHITLGRNRAGPANDALSTALAKAAGWKGGETQVSEVLVLSSELTPEGPIYTVLSRGRLD
jgi:2'-5' RNA ligase